MERAGRLLGKSKLPGCVITDEQIACSAWATAVGKKIASHTKAIGLVRNRLVIEVEDSVWQTQLFTLRSQIVGRLEQITAKPIVGELEFRIGVPKRAPQREETANPASPLFTDEADAIRDPVLRHLYKVARKRASA
jgi:predicted nucleic acid-binding Zn ribbon protein